MTHPNPADLQLVSHTTSDGVTARELELGDVTATLWAPDHAEPGASLVLIGHNGSRHRLHRSVSGRARLLAEAGFRACALDVAGHGPRPRTPHDEQEIADLARRTVPGWRALLTALFALQRSGRPP